MAIHRLLPLLEEAVHVRGNLSAGGAASTASSGMSTMRSAQSATPQLGWMRGREAGATSSGGATPPRPPSTMAGPMRLAGGTK